jgi:hypothetical protein
MIGALEVLAAIGLVLPAALNIVPSSYRSPPSAWWC